ncbi:MPN449 family protein [Mycoplasmoides alvi]|uniref:MPN449 family protein n=1 Tax=Mycoplasmoides alvi TaxID=78580 RepID=UPI00051B49CB|nr:hypothetical protein [Mycoplasmoides alvi]
MSKSTSELLITIRQYLSTIFGNDALVSKLSNNDNFAAVVSKGIAIHNNLEKISNTEDKITSKYLENFKLRTNKDINLNEFENITDLDDIQDEINYLNIAVKNLFNQKSLSEFPININNNVNLDSDSNLNKQQNKINSTDSIDDTNLNNSSKNSEALKGERINNSNFNARKNSNFWSSLSGNNNVFANSFVKDNNSFNSADIVYRAAATKRLNLDVRSGRVYCWEQKPRAILILQFITVLLSLLYVLAGLGVIIAWIYATTVGIKFINTNNGANNEVLINGGNVFTIILTPIILVGFGLNMVIKYSNDWMGKLSYSNKKKVEQLIAQNSLNPNENIPKVNQNLQYYLRPNSIIFAFIVHLLIALIPIGVLNPMVVVININNFRGMNGEMGLNDPVIMAIFITNIILLASFLPLILVLITAKVLNPKQDFNRMQEILNKYTEELKNSGKDPFDSALNDTVGGFGGPFGF